MLIIDLIIIAPKNLIRIFEIDLFKIAVGHSGIHWKKNNHLPNGLQNRPWYAAEWESDTPHGRIEAKVCAQRV